MKFLKLFHKDNKPLTEAELLNAYRRTGEIRLVGELYQPYMQMVFSICYKYLQDDEESKDVVMNIFEKLISDLKVHEIDNFKSWLHSVARNHCLMQLRSQRVFADIVEVTKVGEENLEVNTIDQDDYIRLDVKLDSLENCMKTLIHEQRISIDMFFIQEKCYREISDQTGFDFNKVKSYIQNGKRNLKICMDKYVI